MPPDRFAKAWKSDFFWISGQFWWSYKNQSMVSGEGTLSAWQLKIYKLVPRAECGWSPLIYSSQESQMWGWQSCWELCHTSRADFLFSGPIKINNHEVTKCVFLPSCNEACFTVNVSIYVILLLLSHGWRSKKVTPIGLTCVTLLQWIDYRSQSFVGTSMCELVGVVWWTHGV